MVQNAWRRYGWPATLLLAGALLTAAPLARAAAAADSDAAASPDTTSDAAPDADTSAQPDAAARAAALRKVAASCAADVNRFCPELGRDPAPHDTVICLRAFNVDLALSCRTAIHAASQASQ